MTSKKVNKGTRKDLTIGYSSRERILLWLLYYPYQRLEDLAVATGLHLASVHRQVVTLAANDLVESVKPSLGMARSCNFYYLTTAGIGEVANLVGIAPAQLANMWRVDERSLLHQLPRLHIQARLQDLI